MKREEIVIRLLYHSFNFVNRLKIFLDIQSYNIQYENYTVRFLYGLKDVWTHVRNEEKFENYVKTEISDWLKE